VYRSIGLGDREELPYFLKNCVLVQKQPDNLVCRICRYIVAWIFQQDWGIERSCLISVGKQTYFGKWIQIQSWTRILTKDPNPNMRTILNPSGSGSATMQTEDFFSNIMHKNTKVNLYRPKQLKTEHYC
jgi:hypothetical protein